MHTPLDHAGLDADDDGPEQPLTLTAWIARQRIDFQLIRSRAHQELDALLDQQERRMELDFHRVQRDLNELTQH